MEDEEFYEESLSPEDSARLNSITKQFLEEMEKIGLYATNASISAHAENGKFEPNAEMKLLDKMKNEEIGLILTGTFMIGDVAMSDRILYPDKYNENKLFRTIAPSEAEILREKFTGKGIDDILNDL